jgi:hypothetical protein
MPPEHSLPRGANPNSLALSPDNRTLYVTGGGTNAVAALDLDANGAGRVRGLIPTGWYPNAVSTSADGKYLYIANAKSMPGPNSGNCRGDIEAPGIPDCTMAALRTHIKHLIYIVKENRTYDQVLGDLEVGDGDPSITEFPRRFRPTTTPWPAGS